MQANLIPSQIESMLQSGEQILSALRDDVVPFESIQDMLSQRDDSFEVLTKAYESADLSVEDMAEYGEPLRLLLNQNQLISEGIAERQVRIQGLIQQTSVTERFNRGILAYAQGNLIDMER